MVGNRRTLKDSLAQVIAERPGRTDRELTDVLKGKDTAQQPVNIAARQLEADGVIIRRKRHDGLIGNYPGPENVIGSYASRKEPAALPASMNADTMSEDELKEHLVRWLEAEGWTTEVAWGRTRGIDIDARRGRERWIIEAKGCGSLQPMRVNYFIGILGETLQRMDDPDARYAIAFPDMQQFRNLWERLPSLAKQRTGISALFVQGDGAVRHVQDRDEG
ncbi:MAG: MarR family transcriptional regulator [Rhodospirillaceae bacterium]|jgi:hypothetical protein|nr:MarR family transcriptional regulator [Rhodospirillaceae bacterium]MBT6311365.1 MarR family transcriptional regulator [Rhodospirillaceae bacterium]